ncbi:hypothetical protein F2Q69_00019717 [Brassica cretica]|uniref:Uncharacterized protein n=1 Tax=Brassica cretica TaxID=69181 RepID=A0A8S9Q717_BRACR|nr:hypothetical protein F2Q69_00019717 [Brassica cretica]
MLIFNIFRYPAKSRSRGKISKQIANKAFHIEEGYETTTHHLPSTPLLVAHRFVQARGSVTSVFPDHGIFPYGSSEHVGRKHADFRSARTRSKSPSRAAESPLQSDNLISSASKDGGVSLWSARTTAIPPSTVAKAKSLLRMHSRVPRNAEIYAK